MGKFFRLHRPSLRSKISYVVVLGFAVVVLVLSINPGTTFGADPTFNTPVTVAGGNRLYFDMTLRIRPTDGRAFIIGARGDEYVGLSANNPASPTDPLGFQNIKQSNADLGNLFPYIAFAPIGTSNAGTGYAVWRLKNVNKHGNYESFLRIIPTSYNGVNNFNLGAGFYLSDLIGIQLDQPTVAVASNGDIYVAGYLVGSPVTLALARFTYDGTLHYQGIQTIDTQPDGFRSEMDPTMCIDSSNNIHVVSLFPDPNPNNPSRLMAYSRVGGGGFVGQDITPNAYDARNGTGHTGKDIVCAPDGTTYIITLNGIYQNNTDQVDLYKRLPGVGQSWTSSANQKNIFGGYHKVTSIGITTSPDGRLWVAQGDGVLNGTGRPGSYVKYSDDHGNIFLPAGSSAIPAIQKPSYNNKSVAMDGNGPGGKVYLAGSFNYQPLPNPPEQTYYTFANTVLAPPANLSAIAFSSKQINLSWGASLSASPSTIVKYNLYRSLPNQNSGFTQIAANLTTTSYPDSTGLAYGTTYYYKVTAVADSYPNPSADSNTASATTFSPVAVRFNANPADGQAGVTGYSPMVTVVDQIGGTVTNYSGAVDFSITPGTGESGAILSGQTHQTTFTNGVSSFSGNPLKIDGLGAGYRFRAILTPTGVIGDSNPFNLTGTLTITLPTASELKATKAFTVTATVKNFIPATDIHYNGPVYLTFNKPNSGNGSTAYFYGQTTAFASSGVVTFTNLMIDTPVTPETYNFTASLPSSLGTALSPPTFTVDVYDNSCNRLLISKDGDTCSYTIENLQTALNNSGGKPVYLDHRPTINGYASPYEYTLTATLNVPHGTWLDAGCGTTGPASPQGLKVIIGSNFPFTLNGSPGGTNTFLRGIYLAVAPDILTSSPLSISNGNGQTGNSISCTKVVFEVPST